MKKLLTLALILLITVYSCSSSDDGPAPIPLPTYAMTAKINGVVFEANTPFNNNEFSSTNIFSRYPIEDFVLLQGRQGGIVGNPEINLWLKRSDIVVGTYELDEETFETPPSHFIDLIDNSNDISEITKDGVVKITAVDLASKTVTGTFAFVTIDDNFDPNAPIDYNVTDGTFFYKYE